MATDTGPLIGTPLNQHRSMIPTRMLQAAQPLDHSVLCLSAPRRGVSGPTYDAEETVGEAVSTLPYPSSAYPYFP